MNDQSELNLSHCNDNPLEEMEIENGDSELVEITDILNLVVGKVYYG